MEEKAPSRSKSQASGTSSPCSKRLSMLTARFSRIGSTRLIMEGAQCCSISTFTISGTFCGTRCLKENLVGSFEAAVMQVAAAARDARRAGSGTTLENSSPGDHVGHGLAERAVELVGGLKWSATARCRTVHATEWLIRKTWCLGHQPSGVRLHAKGLVEPLESLDAS